MPIVLNGSTGITTEGMNVDTIVDTTGTGSPSVPNGFEQMFVLPVGTLMWFTGDTAPAGYLVADGTLHSRAAYPDLWSWIVTSGNLAVSDALWDEGQYSPGDGATTFRVPKVDDRFIRGKSSTRAVGLVEEDAIRNITGSLKRSTSTGIAAGSYMSGAFEPGESYSNTTQVLSAAGNEVLFDASNVVPTADENRPKALTMLPCIKAFDSVVEPSVLNAAEMVSTINAKLDKDENIVLGTSVAASGTAVDFVGIPAGVKRITVMFDGVGTNGTSALLIRVGGGAISSTGYVSSACSVGSSPSDRLNVTGFITEAVTSAAVDRNGTIVLSKTHEGVWMFLSVLGRTGSGNVLLGGGVKTLSSTLDRIRITTVDGTDQFDAGTINISWEF